MISNMLKIGMFTSNLNLLLKNETLNLKLFTLKKNKLSTNYSKLFLNILNGKLII